MSITTPPCAMTETACAPIGPLTAYTSTMRATTSWVSSFIGQLRRLSRNPYEAHDRVVIRAVSLECSPVFRPMVARASEEQVIQMRAHDRVTDERRVALMLWRMREMPAHDAYGRLVRAIQRVEIPAQSDETRVGQLGNQRASLFGAALYPRARSTGSSILEVHARKRQRPILSGGR